MKQINSLRIPLSRNQLKQITGGYGDEFGVCTVDCDGCPAYKCASGCDSMENRKYVVCDGVRHDCRTYPDCWS